MKIKKRILKKGVKKTIIYIDIFIFIFIGSIQDLTLNGLFITIILLLIFIMNYLIITEDTKKGGYTLWLTIKGQNVKI